MDEVLNKRRHYFDGFRQAADELRILEVRCHSQEYIREYAENRLISVQEVIRTNQQRNETLSHAYFWQGYIDGINHLLNVTIPDLKTPAVIIDYPAPKI